MTPSRPIKLVAGTVTAAIALSAGAALASDSGDPEPDLKDVVLIRDIDPPEWSPASLVFDQSDIDDSIASPFETADEPSLDSEPSDPSVDSEPSEPSVDSDPSVDSEPSEPSVDSIDSSDGD